MCFWKNLANFVGMKNSIDFLPERKQRDLHELAALIRDEVKDVVMIILYGSYAEMFGKFATQAGTVKGCQCCNLRWLQS